MKNKPQYTPAERIRYYQGRVNDNKLTQGQRNMAARRVSQLSNAQEVIPKPPRSATPATPATAKPKIVRVEVFVSRSQNDKVFAKAKLLNHEEINGTKKNGK